VRADVTIEHVRNSAEAVSKNSLSYRVHLTQGGTLAADIVVLAAGAAPPALPTTISRQLGNDPAVIANPWQKDALAELRPDEEILIMGTGLSMADVVASLTPRHYLSPPKSRIKVGSGGCTGRRSLCRPLGRNQIGLGSRASVGTG
jgi:uncharacterized NAD(P)/FAD-binding protein YdhS